MFADEVTAISNKEQLSPVVRYVDHDTLLEEDLVAFIECEIGISGHGLDLSNMRGQACDGAGNMAGSVNGAAALIRADYPLALYLHCASHSLNLAFVKSLQLTSVRNRMGKVQMVFYFLLHTQNVKGHLKNLSQTLSEN